MNLKLKLNDKVYNILRWIVQIVLPAGGALYFALAQFWPVPEPDLVLGSVVAVSTFLGALLGVSNVQYMLSDESANNPADLFPPSFLSKEAYESLKWLVLILLPSVATLYFTFSKLWGLPYAEEIVGTITSVIAFLGIILGINTYQLNKKIQ